LTTIPKQVILIDTGYGKTEKEEPLYSGNEEE
jgi:hypothetical protein